MENIKPGSIIRGPYWPEPVEIKLVEETGNYIHIFGATAVSRNHVNQIIPRQEFLKLSLEDQGSLLSEEPWKVERL